MKDRLYFYFAAVTHPILIVPLFIILSTLSFKLSTVGVFLSLVLFVPLIILLLLKVNLRDPSLLERRKIYAVVGGGYLLYALLANNILAVNHNVYLFWAPIWAVLMFLMFILNFRYKISWHAMAWGHVLSLTGVFIGVVAYEESVLLTPFFRLALVIILSFVVMRVRYLQNAHSTRELIIGFALGLFLSNLYILLYDIL